MLTSMAGATRQARDSETGSHPMRIASRAFPHHRSHSPSYQGSSFPKLMFSAMCTLVHRTFPLCFSPRESIGIWAEEHFLLR